LQQRDEVQLRSSDQSRGVKKKKKTITWCQQLITGSIQNQTKTLKKITINRYKLQVIVTINLSYARPEERRVGKGVDPGGRRIIKKKKKTKKHKREQPQ